MSENCFPSAVLKFESVNNRHDTSMVDGDHEGVNSLMLKDQVKKVPPLGA